MPSEATDELRKQIMHRNQLLVTNVDSQPVDDVGKWFAAVKTWYRPSPDSPACRRWAMPPAAARRRAIRLPAVRPAGAGRAAPAEGPTGPGIIVQIYGPHYHNAGGGASRHEYVTTR